MPIALEPGVTFEIWLESDSEKPIETRPVFLAKTQSMRQQREIHRVIDLVFAPNATISEVFDSAVECLVQSCSGWRNMGERAFSKDAIEDVLSFSEIREILRKVAANQRMGIDEKK